MISSPPVSSQWRPNFIIWSCWCGAAFGLCFATYDSVRRWEILHGNSAQAKVLKLDSVVHQGRASYTLEVDFVDARNEQYWLELPVAPQQVARLHVGGQVNMRYRANHPTDALLATDSWLQPHNAAALLAALVLYTAGWVRRQRWQREQQKSS